MLNEDEREALVRPHRRLVRRRGRSVMRAPPSATSLGCPTRNAWRHGGRSTASGSSPDQVLVDGNWDFVGGAKRIVRGDASSLSIAAASILAKVSRDRIMRETAVNYPGLQLRGQQGIPLSGAQGGAPGLGADLDPPPILGLHGPPDVERAGSLPAAEPQLTFEFEVSTQPTSERYLASVRLAENDLAMLAGEMGPGAQMAMELLVAAAPAIGASSPSRHRRRPHRRLSLSRAGPDSTLPSPWSRQEAQVDGPDHR